MKKLFLLSVVSLLSTNCNNDDEASIDCMGANVEASLHYAQLDNSRLINCKVDYNEDSKKVSSIEWDFGDGNKTATTEKNVDHQYKFTGSYKVKAKVIINNGVCSLHLAKQVIVN